MDNSYIRVWYVDDEGRYTSCETWTPPDLSFPDGYFYQGEFLDWSNPDKGIRVMRSYVDVPSAGDRQAIKDDAEAAISEYFRREGGADSDHRFDMADEPVVVFTPEQLAVAGEVIVNGRTVLVRASGEERPDFKCGLRYVAQSTEQ